MKKENTVVALKPKERIQYPSLRVMILSAIKELTANKGAASIIAIYKNISAVYRYDVQKNRRHLRKTWEKLIKEHVVEQVKGHGMTGSFKFGKNYKKPMQSKLNKQPTRTSGRVQKVSVTENKVCTNESVNCDAKPGDVLATSPQVNVTAIEHDYCVPSFQEQPILEPKVCIKEENELEEKLSLNDMKENSNLLPVCPTVSCSSSSSSLILESGESELELKFTDDVPQDLSSQEIVSQHSPMFPFNTANYRFECICGKLGLLDYKARVQCLQCHLWQHAECVNYKEENLRIKPFYCPHCLVAMTPVSTGATLIISPNSICHQWVDEINRHVRSSSLQVMVYQGVKKHGFLQPHMLAKQDVVITTYDVLRTELNYVDLPHSNSEDGRRFRNQKRYMAIPSPLVAVEWWRICLDEAQMVECTTAKVRKTSLP